MKDNNSHMKHLKELAQSAGIVFIFGVLGYIMMFFYKLFAARHFGASDFGLYSLAETVLGISVLLITLGIPEGITRYVPIYLHKKKMKILSGYVNFVIKMPFIFSIILMVVLFILSGTIASFFGFPSIFITILKIIAFVLPFRIINNVLRKFFLANKKVIYSQIAYNFIEKAVLIAALALIIFFNLSIIWLVAGLFVSAAVAALYCIYQYRKSVKMTLPSKREYKIKQWMKFSTPLFFSGLFAYFINWTDNLVISRYMAPENLGIYAIAFSLAAALLFFKGLFIPLFVPLISEAKAKSQHKNISFLFKKSSAWTFGLTFPVFLVFVTYAKEIIHILFGVEYMAGANALVIIALGIIIHISFGLGREILILHKKTPFIFWANAVVAVFNIFLNILLVPVWGINGAAASTCISLIIVNLLFFSRARMCEKLNFDFVYALKFIVAGVIAIFLATKIRYFGLHPITLLILSGILYLLIYFVLLLVFKTFKDDDFQIYLDIEKKTGLNLRLFKKIVKKFY